MGIKKFYSSWIKGSNFPNVDIKQIPNKKLNGISIDMNGMLHDIKATTYSYLDAKGGINKERYAFLKSKTKMELEEMYMQNLITKLEDILKKLRPMKYLVMCVDGVAPPAKINQQRSRRYKTAMESMNSPHENFFDSTCLTAGTSFMDAIDEVIRNWIKTNRYKLPKLVAYSSHRIVGEGEHKIFHILKQLLKDEEIVEDEYYHAIYGLDADFVMLSCLAPIENILLIRENYTNIVNIRELRKQLILKLTNGWKTHDKKITMQDYVIMVFFIGNDFLPSIYSLEDAKMALDEMFIHYNERQLILSDSNGNVNWVNFRWMLFFLEKKEREFLVKKACKNLDFPSTLLDSVLEKKLNPNFTMQKYSYDRTLDKYIVTSKFTNAKFEEFRSNWYAKIFGSYENAMEGSSKVGEVEELGDNEEEVEELGDNDEEVEDDEEDEEVEDDVDALDALDDIINNLGDEDAGTTKYKDDKESKTSKDAKDSHLSERVLAEYLKSELKEMCAKYIYGIQWILNYYMGGSLNYDYIYTLQYSPLLYDLLDAFDNYIDLESLPSRKDVMQTENSIKVTFLYQLVSVIPPSSAYLLPAKFRNLILPFGALSDMCPNSFKLDLDGKEKEYESIPILPPLNFQRVKYEVDAICPKVTGYVNNPKFGMEGEKYAKIKGKVPSIPRGFAFETEYLLSIDRNLHREKRDAIAQGIYVEDEIVEDRNHIRNEVIDSELGIRQTPKQYKEEEMMSPIIDSIQVEKPKDVVKYGKFKIYNGYLM